MKVLISKIFNKHHNHNNKHRHKFQKKILLIMHNNLLNKFLNSLKIFFKKKKK